MESTNIRDLGKQLLQTALDIVLNAAINDANLSRHVGLLPMLLLLDVVKMATRQR